MNMVDYTLLPADILDPVLEGYLEDLRADLTDAALASLFVTNDLRDRSYGRFLLLTLKSTKGYLNLFHLRALPRRVAPRLPSCYP